MKVLPITNGGFQNGDLSCKGFVSGNVKYGLNSYVRNFSNAIEHAETNPVKYSNLINFFICRSEFAKKYAAIIIKNMETVMSRFGRSCELEWHSSKKEPLKQIFTIESTDSYYKHICGELILQNLYAQDLAAINTFTNETLAKINPYETNLKFKIMSNHDNYADNFAPEKEFWFPEDNLVDAKTFLFNNNNSRTSIHPMWNLGDIERESTEFMKEFGKVFGKTRKCW